MLLFKGFEGESVFLTLVPVPFVDLAFFETKFFGKSGNHCLVPVGVLLVVHHQNRILVLVLSESPSLLLRLPEIAGPNDGFDVVFLDFLFR